MALTRDRNSASNFGDTITDVYNNSGGDLFFPFDNGTVTGESEKESLKASESEYAALMGLIGVTGTSGVGMINNYKFDSNIDTPDIIRYKGNTDFTDIDDSASELTSIAFFTRPPAGTLFTLRASLAALNTFANSAGGAFYLEIRVVFNPTYVAAGGGHAGVTATFDVL